MKKMQCIKTTCSYLSYGYERGRVYDVDETQVYSIHNDGYWWVFTPGCIRAAFWFPKGDFIDLPDVRTCMKCNMTDPPSDEELTSVPCNKHEWLGGEQ